jgi:hypothetical protein
MATVTVEAELVLDLCKSIAKLGQETLAALEGRERDLEDELRRARVRLLRNEDDDA